LLDPLADLDGEDLACLGLRRANDFMDVFADLRRQAHDEWVASLPKPSKPPKPRKPNIRTLIEQAKAAGVTAVTLPDGSRLELTGAPDPATESNPWRADLKVMKK
jgi:hypothetical protein